MLQCGRARLGPFRLGWAALLFACALRVAAQDAAPAQLLDLGQRWVHQAVAQEPTGATGVLRMDVVVGALDPRLRLAACSRVEPYLPPGARLWGRTRVGLRCLEGPTRWNVFLPLTVHAFGPAWVIKGNVAAGATLASSDAMQVEVDWAEESSAVIADPAQWVGQVANRPLASGQALRQGMIRPAQVFQSGAQVRVLAAGPGFQIATDGQALSAGVIGQPVRVKMDNGRAVSGVVFDARTVRIEL